MSTVKVIVCDAQYLFRLGIVEVLNRDSRFECAGECSNSQELRDLLKSTKPDIITIDYEQSDAFSLDDLRFIQEHAPNTKILTISSDDNSDNIFLALRYGVVSFLTKECDQDEILIALIATAKNEKFVCHRVIDIIIGKTMNETSEIDCKPYNLSIRELEIIQLTAKGLSAKEIAGKLFLSLHTVYTHKKNIMKKLKLNSSSELILYAINNGIAT